MFHLEGSSSQLSLVDLLTRTVKQYGASLGAVLECDDDDAVTVVSASGAGERAKRKQARFATPTHRRDIDWGRL